MRVRNDRATRYNPDLGDHSDATCLRRSLKKGDRFSRDRVGHGPVRDAHAAYILPNLALANHIAASPSTASQARKRTVKRDVAGPMGCRGTVGLAKVQ